MAIKYFTIKLGDVVTGDTRIRNVDVQWEKPECMNISCAFDGNKTLRVSVSEDCPLECIYAKIKWDLVDSCDVCPTSARIKVCPCNTHADCGDCEICDGNLCVSICEPGQTCDKDQCVECSEATPCKNGKECVSGKCKCPADKPYLNYKGDCVACNTSEDCAKCQDCEYSDCVTRKCPNGICDPVTDECTDCLKTGDCTGPNERCIDKKCECEEGFYRDPFTKLCVEKPECEFDSQCPPCHICTATGCQPIVCPADHICVPGRGCVKICDCSQALCDDGSPCVNLNGEVCYCSTCPPGPCVNNGDCGPNCHCTPQGCMPNPCKGKCESGLDCGKGCGCNTNKDCVPCASLSCEECANTPGCECKDNVNCKAVPDCGGPCTNAGDCPDGCGCYRGECVNCSRANCADCGQILGCECKDGIKCEDDGLGCLDDFTIEKIEAGCDLRIMLTKQEECPCTKLVLNTKLNSIVNAGNQGDQIYRASLSVEARKGIASSYAAALALPLLGDSARENIADNDEPTNGSILVTVTPYYQEYDMSVIPKRIKSGIIKGAPTNYSGIYDGTTDTIVFNNLLLAIPLTDAQNGSAYMLYNEVEIIQNDDLQFANMCTYDGPIKIGKFNIDKTKKVKIEQHIAGDIPLNAVSPYFSAYKQISSDDSRLPMITVYRSKTNTFDKTNIISKIYTPKTGNAYIFDLFGPDEIPNGKFPLTPEEGGLYSNRYWKATNDCSCDKEASIGKLVFCNPDELFFDLLSCDTKIKLKTPFQPCDVNQDLTQWDVPAIERLTAQVKYDLYLNDIKVKTFVHHKDLGMIEDGTSLTMFGREFSIPSGERIKTIKLKINHDDKDECTLSFEVPEPQQKIDFTKNCSVEGKNYTVTILKSQNSTIISNVTSLPVVAVENLSDRYILTLEKKKTTKIIVTYGGGCKKEFDVFDDCCDALKITLTRTTNNMQSNLDIAANIAGGQAPFNVTWTKPTGVIASKQDVTGFTANSYVNGTYRMRIVDAIGCTTEAEINVDKGTIASLEFSPDVTICAGTGGASIKITGNASTVGGTLTYTRSGVPNTIILGLDGGGVISGITTNTEFNFVDLTIRGGTIIPIGVTRTITVVTNPTANLTGSQTICQGSEATLVITGPAGAQVTVNNGVGIVTIEPDGSVNVIVEPVTNTSYSITNVQLDRCLGTGVGTAVVQVVPGVPIELSSANCNPSLTLKTLTFNTSINTAVDQNGAPIAINGGGMSVTVNPLQVSSVKVTKTGACTSELTVNVTACGCPTIDFDLTGPTNICFNGTAELEVINVTGGSQYSYEFSRNGVVMLPVTNNPKKVITEGGLYTVVVHETLINCDSEPVAITVTQGVNMPVDVIPQPGDNNITEVNPNFFQVCENAAEAIVQVNGSFVTYAWYETSDPGAIISTDQTMPYAPVNYAKFYTVKVTDVNGCTFYNSFQINSVACVTCIAPVQGLNSFYKFTDDNSTVMTIYDRNGTILVDNLHIADANSVWDTSITNALTAIGGGCVPNVVVGVTAGAIGGKRFNITVANSGVTLGFIRPKNNSAKPSYFGRLDGGGIAYVYKANIVLDAVGGTYTAGAFPLNIFTFQDTEVVMPWDESNPIDLSLLADRNLLRDEILAAYAMQSESPTVTVTWDGGSKTASITINSTKSGPGSIWNEKSVRPNVYFQVV